MQVILAQILAATQSTSSATVNTTGLNTSSMAYQPSFDTSDADQDWTGNILAYPIDPTTGAVETSMLQWSAQAQLDAQDCWHGVRGPQPHHRYLGSGGECRHAVRVDHGQSHARASARPPRSARSSRPIRPILHGQDALNYLRGDRALEDRTTAVRIARARTFSATSSTARRSTSEPSSARTSPARYYTFAQTPPAVANRCSTWAPTTACCMPSTRPPAMSCLRTFRTGCSRT